MGRMIDGRWVRDDASVDRSGRFVRPPSTFRSLIEDNEGSLYRPAAQRYHLYVSAACGWSHRTLIVRALLGLEQLIGVSTAEPYMGAEGWTFPKGSDALNGIAALHELYALAVPDYSGKVTVPVLWDSRTSTIVSNESTLIIKSFATAFGRWATPTLQLLPATLEHDIDAMVEQNHNALNNGVYRAGFAREQKAYATAVSDVFRRLDELERLLEAQPYLLGDSMTLADVCLFPTLYRFDAVYHYHFKCNLKRLVDYPNLWRYTRGLYQQPAIRSTCHMDEIKHHYYTSHESINPSRVIPLGPRVDFDEKLDGPGSTL